MNILLLYPEFPFSFWSLPNSCRFKGCKSLYYPLGLLTVAAMLPAEWKLRLINLNFQRLTQEDWR